MIKIEIIEKNDVDEMFENKETEVTVQSSIKVNQKKEDEKASQTKSGCEGLLDCNRKKGKAFNGNEEKLELEVSLQDEVVPVPKIDETFEVDGNDNLNLNHVETEELPEISTVWENFVNKLTVKVGAKKIKYQQLIDKKTVLVSHRENVQERKLESELRIVSVSEEIKGKRKFIETWEEGMKRLKQAINQEMKEIDELNDCVSEETKKVDSSYKTIQKLVKTSS